MLATPLEIGPCADPSPRVPPSDGEQLAGRTVERGLAPSLAIAVDAGGRAIGRLELDEGTSPAAAR